MRAAQFTFFLPSVSRYRLSGVYMFSVARAHFTRLGKLEAFRFRGFSYHWYYSSGCSARVYISVCLSRCYAKTY